MGAEHNMARRIQLRRDTAENWSTSNPTLAQGEVGIDLTNNKIKIGNGTQAWNSLAYFDDNETVLSNYAGNIIPSTDDTYTLGTPEKRWKDVFVTEGSVYIGDVKLSNNNGTLVINRVTDGGLETEQIVEGGTDAVQVDLSAYATKEELPVDISDLTDTQGLLSGNTSVTISDTAPNTAEGGDLWWDSETGRLKIYYVDEDTEQWVDSFTSSGNSSSSTYSSISTTSNSITIDLSQSLIEITLNQSINTINFVNIPSAGTTSSTTVVFIQDATGNRTVSGSGFLTQSGVGLQISALANSISVVNFTAYGSTIIGFNVGQEYQ